MSHIAAFTVDDESYESDFVVPDDYVEIARRVGSQEVPRRSYVRLQNYVKLDRITEIKLSIPYAASLL